MESKPFSVELPNVERAITNAKNHSDLEPLLKAIVAAQTSITSNKELYGKKLYFDSVDQKLEAICEKLDIKDVADLAESNDRIVIIATEVYPIGGHTRIVEDIKRLAAQKHCSLILSDMRNVYDHFGPNARALDFLDTTFDSVVICKNPSYTGRICEIYSILRACKPTRIFLVNHHADILSAVACWPFRNIVNFIHHTDHQPCFGASLSAFKHLDVTYACHKACREHVLRSEYIGMSLPFFDQAKWRPAQSASPLHLATSGTQRKYVGTARYRWVDWASSALKAGVSTIKHIGPVSDDFRDHVHGALALEGVDKDRYEFLGGVRSVSNKLVECSANLYLSSYPESGFRGNLEALSCGIPVLVLEDSSTPDLLRFKSPLHGWHSIQSPQELPEAIDRAWRSDRPSRETVKSELERFERFIKTES